MNMSIRYCAWGDACGQPAVKYVRLTWRDGEEAMIAGACARHARLMRMPTVRNARRRYVFGWLWFAGLTGAFGYIVFELVRNWWNRAPLWTLLLGALVVMLYVSISLPLGLRNARRARPCQAKRGTEHVCALPVAHLEGPSNHYCECAYVWDVPDGDQDD